MHRPKDQRMEKNEIVVCSNLSDITEVNKYRLKQIIGEELIMLVDEIITSYNPEHENLLT